MCNPSQPLSGRLPENVEGQNSTNFTEQSVGQTARTELWLSGPGVFVSEIEWIRPIRVRGSIATGPVVGFGPTSQEIFLRGALPYFSTKW